MGFAGAEHTKIAKIENMLEITDHTSPPDPNTEVVRRITEDNCARTFAQPNKVPKDFWILQHRFSAENNFQSIHRETRRNLRK